MTVEKESGQRGATGGPPWGQPTQGQRLLGPTFTSGSLTVVGGLSLCAFTRSPLNRGWERGVFHSHSLFHSLSHSLPLTSSCSDFHWILAQVWFQEISLSLSHFFTTRLSTHLEEQLLGNSFFFH